MKGTITHVTDGSLVFGALQLMELGRISRAQYLETKRRAKV